MSEIKSIHDIKGKETIPLNDKNLDSWEMAIASNWSTLIRAGGYDDQPLTWLKDVAWFNTWNYYYQLESELTSLDAYIRGAL